MDAEVCAEVGGGDSGAGEKEGGVQGAGGDDDAFCGDGEGDGVGWFGAGDGSGNADRAVAVEQDTGDGTPLDAFCARLLGVHEVGYGAAALSAGGTAVGARTAEVRVAAGVARDGGGTIAGQVGAAEEFEGLGGVEGGVGEGGFSDAYV